MELNAIASLVGPVRQLDNTSRGNGDNASCDMEIHFIADLSSRRRRIPETTLDERRNRIVSFTGSQGQACLDAKQECFLSESVEPVSSAKGECPDQDDRGNRVCRGW